MSQQGGEAVYPLPRIKALEVHPKLSLATLLFAVSIAFSIQVFAPFSCLKNNCLLLLTEYDRRRH